MFLLMLPPLPSTHSCFPEVDLPPSFFPGQRWLSETEPELGLGLVTEVDGRQVVVLYPASQETRRYLSSSAPLRRVKFREGDELQTPTGDSFVIHSITQEQGVITYHGEGFSLVETQLAGDISNDSPEERLRIGHVDTAQSFSLRKDLWAFRQRWARSPARGLMGPRIQLLPHQLYIAHQVINRQRPRVLLADEPGLGKTIESGLILHHSLLTGRVRRVLVLVPESLLHQWFVEFLRRFQLVFRIVDDSHCNAVEKNDSSANPFEDDAFILCSLSWLTKHPLRMAQVVKAQWDMLVVDEAHHISEESPSAALLTELSLKVPGVLLLTATPEQLGARSHFARLKILDPERYQNFDEYERKHDHYQALADIAAKLLDTAKPFGLTASERTYWDHHDSALLTLLDKTQGTDEAARSRCVTDLLDRFGPGRVIFRNTRQAIAGFPTREVNLYPLPLNKGPGIEAAMDATQIHPKDPRLEWLLGWLNKNPEQKALCICTSRSMVESIEFFVRGISHVPLAVFHEGLSLIQRDRNAAWFSEPDGARLLVCSEIGGEGRNFQVAQHLILFDLPDDPELLEQRIGRLDRIGQAPRIFLHVPYVSGTHQEVLARWFHCGMDILRRSRPGGSLVQEAFLDRLKSMESRPFNEE
ncbi:RNA polymerase-associated protein RapA, partial [Myxococcota bacterium]|nr:RNA polymerase-associated protein RapA [Myxococcota bacterium]